MAAKWKEPPRDALDTLVLGAVDMPSMASVVQTDFMPFDPTVKVSSEANKECLH
jgi:H+-transporting ATPase